MSFGYSIGDILAGGNLAYKLLRVMADTQCVTKEYREAMAELGAMQQAFMQVSQLQSHESLPQATVNSATFIVMSSLDMIEAFYLRTKEYQRQLSSPQNRGLQSSWQRVGWNLFKEPELRELRDTLHSRLSSINTLLTIASQ
jgi:hypothetical protein